ncbi:hypothetical protein [Streptomyces sp. NPDC059071]|uniref:hypothetical protein n=1 Tax=unclassified Streptomyces TaxID=2593676 RepID=UPI0036611A19
MPEEATRRTDLTDLVDSRMGEANLSYRTLAARTADPDDTAENPEPQWTRGTLENLRKGRKIKAPTPEQVRGLAAGLQLPVRLVEDAARAQFFDVDAVRVGESDLDDETLLLVRHYQELTPEDQLKLRRIAQDWSRPGRASA